jgi:hypothetical protein
VSGGTILGGLLTIAFIAFWIGTCSAQWSACEAAGGHPVYEYKNLPSCWDAEGRRIFP